MEPIYSYDVRANKPDVGSHWKDAEVLGDRGYFRTISEPSTLSVDSVEERDQGEYRCRVDFRMSPTRNSKVHLNVIVPPQKPNIFDEHGKELTTTAGPYKEGEVMKLTCIVPGGKPPPRVRWWRGEVLYDATESPSSFPEVRENQLIVSHLSRSDLHSVFTCQASNNNISQPVSASVSIEMHFKPLSAAILSSNQPLSADRKYELVCQTIGSRPPAKITWWLENKSLKDSTDKVSADGNETLSTLQYRPIQADNGKTLTCRAENSLFESGKWVEEDTWKLDVHYMPKVSLQLAKSFNPDDIEEGDDVYFECNIDANPPTYKVVWKHNGQVLQHKQKHGVLMSQTDFLLSKVSRNQAGNYTCIASNIEGDGESNNVELRVMYKPICRMDQKRVYGVARNEEVRIGCEVEAFPPADNFRWVFNNSADHQDVSRTRYQNSPPVGFRSSSLLQYTPVGEMDYGTVLCWASNFAGEQVEPCLFHIISAGRPDAPTNCTLINQTTESLEVECVESFDGGQQQYFLLEVIDIQTGQLQANVSSKFPVFRVSGLHAGRVLRMQVYAANIKGRSEAVILDGSTLEIAEKQTGSGSPGAFPMLGLLLGVLIGLLFLGIVVLGVIRVGRCAPGGESRHANGSAKAVAAVGGQRPGNLPLKEKATIPLRPDVEDLYDMDDKNPDVIPCNKDSDYQLVAGVGTPAGLNNRTPPESASMVTPSSASSSTTRAIRQPQPVQRNGDLYDTFKNGLGRYAAGDQEVTYAELCHARPNTLPGGVRGDDNSTIYAQIDHTAAPRHGYDPTAMTPVSSLTTPLSPTSHPMMMHREIVTVRTPLMANQQESCV